MSGLRRWKEDQDVLLHPSFGDVVCEDDDTEWYFQIPNQRKFYPDSQKKWKKKWEVCPYACGTIDKEIGEIEVLLYDEEYGDQMSSINFKHPGEVRRFLRNPVIR